MTLGEGLSPARVFSFRTARVIASCGIALSLAGNAPAWAEQGELDPGGRAVEEGAGAAAPKPEPPELAKEDRDRLDAALEIIGSAAAEDLEEIGRLEEATRLMEIQPGEEKPAGSDAVERVRAALGNYRSLRPRLDPAGLPRLLKRLGGAPSGSPLEAFLLDEIAGFKDRPAVEEAVLGRLKGQQGAASNALFVAAGRLGGHAIVDELARELAAAGEGDYSRGLAVALANARETGAVKALLGFSQTQTEEARILVGLGPLTLLLHAGVPFDAADLEALKEIFGKTTSPGVKTRALEVLRELAERPSPKFPPDALEEFREILFKAARAGEPGLRRVAASILALFPEEKWEPVAQVFKERMGSGEAQEIANIAHLLKSRRFAAETVPLLLPAFREAKDPALRRVFWGSLRRTTGQTALPEEPAAWEAWWKENGQAETNRWKAKVLENLAARRKAPEGSSSENP